MRIPDLLEKDEVMVLNAIINLDPKADRPRFTGEAREAIPIEETQKVLRRLIRRGYVVTVETGSRHAALGTVPRQEIPAKGQKFLLYLEEHAQRSKPNRDERPIEKDLKQSHVVSARRRQVSS
jgi:hypothetical protein